MMQGSGAPMPGKSSLPWIVGTLVAVAVVGTLYFVTRSDEKSADEAMMEASKDDAMMKEDGDAMEKESDSMMKKQEVTVTLGAQNASGQEGKAVLSETDGKTKVTIAIGSGAAGIAQPAHIHVGSCPAPGAVKYPLTNVVDGRSETVLDVSLATLAKELPLAINVHKSKDDAKTYVSCGNIVMDGMKDAAMMEKDGAMMENDTAMMAKAGSYETYEASKLAMAKEGDVVLFFRASWCPTCRALDADIKKNLSAIPVGVTILDVDYDRYADLKKQYGVTTQHTLVQVDADGKEIAKWVGSATLAELAKNVK